MEEMRIQPIAHIRTAMPEKFGIPRQSGVVPDLKGAIFFAPAYREREALRGLEAFSHLWLIWQFSAHLEKMEREGWSPTVRPPRLGGNERVGVFASRSPYRPNSLGLSLVKLEAVVLGKNDLPPAAGLSLKEEEYSYPCLLVSGVDILDKTPIFDIKPYLPYAEAIPEAKGGFTEDAWKKQGESRAEERLQVVLTPEIGAALLPEEAETVKRLLAADPRPSYQEDPARVYGMRYGDYNLRFRVEEGVVYLLELEAAEK